ncbi:pilus assembly protein [Clostridiaceae bacterium]|nr:pilus assembly protein [Clostridiaceae bacterium]
MGRDWRSEDGVILVEASLYFPLVIFTVFAMIYFGMVKYQESILTFQVQKMAILGGREIAYPGYQVFSSDGTAASSAVDFSGEKDFSPDMKNYYSRHAEHLYQEWKFNYDEERHRLEDEWSGILRRRSFLTGIDTTIQVEIQNYVITRKITVKATYGLKSPKLLKFIGVPADLTLKTYITQSAANPTELVRNMDLAVDLIDFLLERFGVKDQVDSFLKKAEDIKDKIL